MIRNLGCPPYGLAPGEGQGNQASSVEPGGTGGLSRHKKTALCTNTVLLSAPLPNKHFVLYMDASDVGLGAVLTQDTPMGGKPVFFLSCKLTKVERNYAVTKKEAPANRWAMVEFMGQQFMVVMGHASLQWLQHTKKTNPQLMRWYLALQPY